MEDDQIREAFDAAYDRALVFHGFTDYLRDYDVYVNLTADPKTGIPPRHLRYRFTHCVRATVTTTVDPDVWAYSLDDALTDYDEWLRAGEPAGYVWGVKWQCLYPGMRLVPDSQEARRWSEKLGVPFHEAVIDTNGHTITLLFSDLRVTTVTPGHAPFVVPHPGPTGRQVKR